MLFAGQALFPNVELSRIQDVEAFGAIAETSRSDFSGDKVVTTCVNGLGRNVDEGYAEYTLLKAKYARSIVTQLPCNIKKPPKSAVNYVGTAKPQPVYKEG